MEDKKRKGLIALLIIIIIILGGFVFLLATETITFKSSEKKNNPNSNDNVNQDDSTNQNSDIVLDDEEDDANENMYSLGKSGQANMMLEKNEAIEFYQDDKLISTYKCAEKQCEIVPFATTFKEQDGESDDENHNLNIGDYVLIALCDSDECDYIDAYNGTHFIKDTIAEDENASGSVILYNIKTGKQEKKYSDVSEILYADGNLKLLKYKNGSYLLLSRSGKINTKFVADELVLTCYEGCGLYGTGFSYESKLVVSKKNNKYGIKNAVTGKLIVDYNYNDIKLQDSGDGTYYNKDYFIGQVNGKRNLYKVSDSRKVTSKGYEDIYFIDEDTLLVLDNKELSIIDKKENKLTNNTIKVKNPGLSVKVPGDGIRIYKADPEKNSKEPDTIYLAIYDGDLRGSGVEVSDTYYYRYNLKTKKLTESNHDALSDYMHDTWYN